MNTNQIKRLGVGLAGLIAIAAAAVPAQADHRDDRSTRTRYGSSYSGARSTWRPTVSGHWDNVGRYWPDGGPNGYYDRSGRFHAIGASKSAARRYYRSQNGDTRSDRWNDDRDYRSDRWNEDRYDRRDRRDRDDRWDRDRWDSRRDDRHDYGLHKGWTKGKHKGWYKNGKR
jgi:hypothetical protein